MVSVINEYYLGQLLYAVFVLALYILTLMHVFPSWMMIVSLMLAFVPICYAAFKKLREKKIGTEFFLTIATSIALLTHQEKAMNVVLLIMLFAEYLEHVIMARAHNALQSLLSMIPAVVIIKRNGSEIKVPLEQVQEGMLVVVNTGSRIPVDGSVVQGIATINQASLTGESVPVEKKVSESVYAGTFIESGSLIIKTERVGSETLFGKMSLLVQEAEKKKAHISVLSDTIALYLVPSLLVVIGITWLITRNVTLVTTLLVFGSPLELTLITPLAILSGVVAAFRNGILIKGGLALEKFSQADTIIFDKTGTLTIGEPVVVRVQSFNPDYNERIIVQLAAIAEKRSDHVLAKAILTKAKELDIQVPDPEYYMSVAGHGVEMVYKDKRYFIGNRHFVEAPEHGNVPVIDSEHATESEQLSSFYLASEDGLIGKLFIADAIRPDAKYMINSLKTMGCDNLILLSGDQQAIAASIAKELNIPHARGHVFPDEKLKIIADLQTKKHIVAMVGDGINDAPALKQANVGIAMGAMGMEPAIEAADIVLMTNDLKGIVFIYGLSKKIFATIRQNLLFGFALIHGFGMILTFFGYVDPLRAALFHAVSDVAILLNSVRLINFKLK